MSAAAVIVAGGKGLRVGGGIPKQYLEVAGVPVLLRAIRPFLIHDGVDAVVVVLPPPDAESPPEWLRGLRLRVVAGGAERGDSVWNGLAAVPAGTGIVLVHDGARPFIDAPLIDRVLAGARAGGAIAAVPVTDTIKQVGPDGVITGTPERARLWRAQTPQGFPLPGLLDAYRRARAEGMAATDDAALYERYVGPVRVVQGAERNIKVTYPQDLAVAECLALAAPSGEGE
jgi:2-C-methyl-D-erythritol 4-phosphate cytidylyltransferase